MNDTISVYSCDGSYETQSVESFDFLVENLHNNRRELFECPSEVVISLLDQLGKLCIRDPDLCSVEGMPYLSLWLRKKNLNELFSVNFGDFDIFNKPVSINSRIGMIAVPRGIICHWIAGNVPLLGVFSLVLATLGKNASVLKISPEHAGVICRLLNRLSKCSIISQGVEYSGQLITDSIAVVSFPGRDQKMSTAFSLAADCRVMYGSEDAVQTISRLRHQVHCETILYGPKYSFAVFDQESILSPDFSVILEGLARDIIQFNQTACSSPHVVFCEKGSVSIHQVAELLKNAFDHVPAHLFSPLSEKTAVRVINTRARYLLDEQKDILASSDLTWTICINDELSLEEPVQGRCIFLKEVDDIWDVLNLITRKVQTVGLCIGDKNRRMKYIQELAYRGVDRVMTPGTMHEYTQPWDGILGAERMVRWIAMKRE